MRSSIWNINKSIGLNYICLSTSKQWKFCHFICFIHNVVKRNYHLYQHNACFRSLHAPLRFISDGF